MVRYVQPKDDFDPAKECGLCGAPIKDCQYDHGAGTAAIWDILDRVYAGNLTPGQAIELLESLRNPTTETTA